MTIRNLVPVLLTSLALVGCAPEPPPAVKTGPIAAKSDHGHDHDHDHDAHAHATEGPHGGQVIELGKEEYHLELTHDEAAKSVTIFVLDSSVKNPNPIEAKEITLNIVAGDKPAQFTLPAAPLEGETPEKASRFTLVSDEALTALETPKAKGRVNLKIGEKTFSGEFTHEEHDHDHDHK